MHGKVRTGRRWALFGMLASVVLGSTVMVVGAQGDGDAPTAIGSFEARPCAAVLPLESRDSVDDSVTCGFVTVPERHANPDGPTIRLAVAVVGSLDDNPLPDPLVIESGGPGFPSLLSVPAVMAMEPMRAKRDLVIVEQRGIGTSQPELLCNQGVNLVRAYYGQNPSDEEVAELERAVLSTCWAKWQSRGVDVSAFNSLENAADFPMVMQALGYETYNFYGVSYASSLGQHILRTHPEGLRSVILDSVVPMGTNFLESTPRTAGHAFRRLFDNCAADAACHTQFPDIEAQFYALVDQYNAEPITVTRSDPWTGGPTEIVVTGDFMVLGLYEALYNTRDIALLPAAIGALADGDMFYLTDLTPATRFSTLRLTSGMSNAVICSEWVFDRVPAPPDVHPAVTRTMRFYMNYEHICEEWPVEPLPDWAREPVTSDVPALILSGEYDPVTPPENAAAIAPYLTNAYSITVPGVGHSTLGASLCSIEIALAFLDDPMLAPDDSCLEELGTKFALSLDATAGLILEPVTFEAFGVRTVVPQGWTRLDEATFGGPGYSVLLAVLMEREMSAIREPFIDFDVLPVDELKVNGRAWRRYNARLQQYEAVIMVTVGGRGYYVVGLLDATGNRDALVDAVLIPAIEAFEVVE